MTTSTAAILAIGSEMLGPTRVDTNSLKITAVLEEYGIELVRKSVIGDRLGHMVSAMEFVFVACDILLITGGLGPTEDDMTREALAAALGLELIEDPTLTARLEARFAARGMKMPDVNRKQAQVFRGQTTLINERGTAPGFHLEVRGKHVWVFPGVPHELEWMLATYFRPWLAEIIGGVARHRRVLKIAGMTESAVDEHLKPYYDAHPGELTTILASPGGIEIHLVAPSAEEIATRERELLELFGNRVFGFDDDTLESVVGELLVARNATLATAESCTGGMLSSRITDVAGSSRYFMGGGVCYTAEAKTAIAGVDPELIRNHGEVSEEVAIALAKGIRESFGTTWGISITGVAGPGGGSEAKPVGTVHIAVAGPDVVEHRKMFWPATRNLVRWFSTQWTLDLLRKTILRSSTALILVMLCITGQAETRRRAAPFPQSDSDFTPRGNERRTGSPAVHGPARLSRARWKAHVATPRFSPSLSANVLYIPSLSGAITGLDATTGTTLFTFTPPSGPSSPVVIRDGVLYFAAGHDLFALRATDRGVLWRSTLDGDASAAAPLVTGDTVYAGTSAGSMYALRLGDGGERWRFQATEPILWPPALENGVLNFSSRSRLYAVDTATGSERWHITNPSEWQPLAVSNGVIFAGLGNNDFQAIDAHDGHVIWTFDDAPSERGGWSSPAAHGSMVFAGNGTATMYAFDAASGQVSWRFTADDRPEDPVHADGVLYFGVTAHSPLADEATRQRTLYALDAQSGVVASTYRQAKMSLFGEPVLRGGSLWALANNDLVYAIDAEAPVLLSVGGNYPTHAVLDAAHNTCGAVTVQDNLTSVAHTAGATTLSLTHAGNTYDGTIDDSGHFSTTPKTLGGGSSSFVLTITGQFTVTGFTASVQVDATQAVTPRNCSYVVNWTGVKEGNPNTIP